MFLKPGATLLVLLTLCAASAKAAEPIGSSDRGIARGALVLATALDDFGAEKKWSDTRGRELTSAEIGRVSAMKRFVGQIEASLYSITNEKGLNLGADTRGKLNKAIQRLRILSRENHFSRPEELSMQLRIAAEELRKSFTEVATAKPSLWSKLTSTSGGADPIHDAALGAMGRAVTDAPMGLKPRPQPGLADAAQEAATIAGKNPHVRPSGIESVDGFWEGVDGLLKDYMDVLGKAKFEISKGLTTDASRGEFFKDTRKYYEALSDAPVEVRVTPDSFEAKVATDPNPSVESELEIVIEVDSSRSPLEKLQLLASPGPLCERMLRVNKRSAAKPRAN